jgi:DNA-binding LytR/AlgR family response regulator
VTFRLTERRHVIVEVPPAEASDNSVPLAIATKLPPRLTRSTLVAVEAQDHYLRILTRDGEALIHMRFSDALAALAQSDGTRAHRSWWVARSAIESTKFANGRGEISLDDGSVVPVSRSFAQQVKSLARQPKPSVRPASTS